MKIIAISGPANSGKTACFREFYKKHIMNNPEFVIIKSFGTKNSMDYKLVLEYKEIRIGIFSMGDRVELMEEKFRYIGNCDIVIGACHTRGSKTFEYIQSKVFSVENDFFLIEKEKGKNDNKVVKEMYKLLMELCSQK